MEFDAAAWIQLAVRWFHFVAGIAWIGASFHFIWLDNSLEKPKSAGADGVAGEAWLVHGGGFYHNVKYAVAPAELPKHLHWFKWEAYSTWLSGFALLILIYYMSAELYLIDPLKLELEGWQATAIGLSALAGGWLVYDGLCRSPLKDNTAAISVLWFMAMTAAAWGLTHVFSDRGAAMHVGAMLGTVMVANVFFVIIPNQTKTVAAMVKGEAPDPALGAAAKQRSLHNNYMTLPVLFFMISGHFPMVVGHDLNWAIFAALSAISILIRHFFNLKHQGRLGWEFAGWGVAGGIALALLASVDRTGPVLPPPPTRHEAQVLAIGAIVERHCAPCHAQTPSHAAFAEAPNGIVLDSLDAVLRNAPLVYQQAVANELMPLGNETRMSAAERRILGDWLEEATDGGAG